MAYLPVWIILGVAFGLLLVEIVMVLGPIRRFRVALAEYRQRLDAETRLLQAGREAVRVQLDHVRHPDGDRPASTIGNLGETEERHG